VKNLKKYLLLAAVLITVFPAFSKNYYVKQILIASAQADGRMDTLTQETFISDDLIIIADEFSITYIDDKAYEFYNTTNKTFYKKTFKELTDIMYSTDSQLKDFEMKTTGEKKKIGPWNTEKYLGNAKVMDMAMDLDMYVAKDTGFPADLMIRQQEKMQKDSKNIKNMMDKIKATGGIVVREVARIGGTVVSEKEITAMKIIDKIDEKYTKRPEGYTEMKQ